METQYTLIRLRIEDPTIADILMTELFEQGYDSFEEHPSGLDAYVATSLFDRALLEQILSPYTDLCAIAIESVEPLQPQNWNAVWESNFQPVIIQNRIVVKAPFHDIVENYPHTIVIEPKMAFGTGHHETTAMMLEAMLDIELSQKAVLDFGCGTGILAIFAAQNHASPIVAIDYDPLSTENTADNCQVNNIEGITILLGDQNQIPERQLFDVVLANITRNVIFASFDRLYNNTAAAGVMLFSGILTTDVPDLIHLAEQYSLRLQQQLTHNNWAMLAFRKA